MVGSCRTLPPEGAVIFCNEASGDEEVPQLVRGVVVSRDLPVLSHLALRARQLGVVFACTAESQLFEKLRKNVQETKAVKLVVDASGDVRAQVFKTFKICPICWSFVGILYFGGADG